MRTPYCKQDLLRAGPVFCDAEEKEEKKKKKENNNPFLVCRLSLSLVIIIAPFQP